MRQVSSTVAWVLIAALGTFGCAKGEGPGGGDQVDARTGGNPDANTINFPDAAPGAPDANNPGGPDAGAMTVTLRQTNSDTITDVNSVSCNNGTTHDDNRYFRVYDLPALGINSAFNVTGVQAGIESASSGGGSQSIDIRIHTLNGTPSLANLTQITSTPFTVTDQTLSIINVPVTATVPAGSKMVVEFHQPDGSAAGNLLFIGSNTAGESAGSYVVAPATGCDLTDMTLLSSVAANVHIILKVTGTYNP